jgi:hypothetical protein
MRRSRTASRPKSLICFLSGSGELCLVDDDSARSALRSRSVHSWTLSSFFARLRPYRRPWAGMPASAVTPRCAVSPTGSSAALPAAPKFSPYMLHEARIHGAATDLRAQHLSSACTLTATPLRKEVWQ